MYTHVVIPTITTGGTSVMPYPIVLPPPIVVPAPIFEMPPVMPYIMTPTDKEIEEWAERLTQDLAQFTD